MRKLPGKLSLAVLAAPDWVDTLGVMPNEPSSRLPFSLAICGVSELPKAVERQRPTHVISITDPADEPLDFPEAVAVLRLAFWDVHVIDGMVARKLSPHDSDAYPSAVHALAILDFGRQVPARGRLLIHCGAGISRSTAAAFILAAQAKPGDEWGAFQLIKVLRPQAQPNPLLVRFADKLLGAEGRMAACLWR